MVKDRVVLDLSPEQAELLRETLDSVLGDLRYEISDTDRMDFREMLKVRKALLMQIVEELKAA